MIRMESDVHNEEVVFVRHNVTNESEEDKVKILKRLPSLFNEKNIALFWDGVKSFDPKDYENPSAKSQFGLLQKCFDHGAIIVARYENQKGGVIIGKIKRGAEKKRFEQCGSVVLKVVELEDARYEKFIDHPRLMIPVGRQTICRYNERDRDYVVSISDGKPLLQKLDNLHPSQMEVLCYEYMKHKGLIHGLLLPIGRSLENVDIIGLRVDTNTWITKKVVAQVTFEKNEKIIKSKCEQLSKLEDCKKYFFGQGDNSHLMSADIDYICLEDVFKELQKEKKYQILIQNMIK